MGSSLFGCLVTHRSGDGSGYNGPNVANQSFLRAIIRYSQFSELHLFLIPADLEGFRSDWQSFIDTYGAGKQVTILSVNLLPEYFSTRNYTVFHSDNHYISDLVALREHHASVLFPIVGRAHTLGDDTRLSRVRDLILAPVKSCDAILCSSSSQKKVMKRLLSSASTSLSDSLGIAISYRGQLKRQSLGMETESACKILKSEARQLLNLNQDVPVILCLGHLSPVDEMDLHPLLLALNDVLEDRGIDDFLLVIAGTADARDACIQSLIKRTCELNLEEKVRFELTIDDARKDLLFRSADIFVSLADNVQENFGLTALEAMRESVPVVLSDWNGYGELVENGVSGVLVPTSSTDLDTLTRSLSLINARQSRFLEAQATAVEVSVLTEALVKLLNDTGYRQHLGNVGRQRLVELFAWPELIQQYHELVAILQKEADGLSFRAGRAVGMSFQNAFGHYSAENIDKTQCLRLTDRGLRVLLQTEHGFFFSELRELLDQQRIYSILEACVEAVTVESLTQQFENIPHLPFILQWMRKYQLLQVVEKNEKGRHPLLSVAFPEKDLPISVILPESRRGNWIKPVLADCLDYLQNIIQPVAADNDTLLQSLADELIRILDEAALQAIGWFAKKQKMSIYSEVMDALEQKGGLVYLANRYPVWYRTRHLLVIRYLRSVKRLVLRLKADMPLLSVQFQKVRVKSPQKLNSVSVVNGQQRVQTFILSLDNNEQLVYKDRDLRIDRFLVGDQEGLGVWVNNKLSHARLGLHRIVCCQDASGVRNHYGYARYLHPGQPCLSFSPEQAADYYRNLGCLLGFGLFTGLADMHQLNFIHRDTLPYLIDAETAFHGGVLRHLGEELENPGGLLPRGFAGSSFEESGLHHLWQAFHTSRLNCCSVMLKNGELLDAEPLVSRAVTGHLLQVSGLSVLEEEGQQLAAQYLDDLLTGFRDILNVIGANAAQWQKSLQQTTDFAIRYQPFLNLNDLRKQLRDIYVSAPLQGLGQERLQQYVRRAVKRTTLAAEAGQKWLDAQWLEPVDRLALDMADSLLRMELPVLLGSSGNKGLLGKDGRNVVKNFFNKDRLAVAQEYAERLADKSVRDGFINSYQAMLENWLTRELKPGEEMPAALKENVLDSLSGKQDSQS